MLVLSTQPSAATLIINPSYRQYLQNSHGEELRLNYDCDADRATQIVAIHRHVNI